MPLNPTPLALALALALAAPVAGAQTLPRRVNLEIATQGDVERDFARDRHVFDIEPGRPVLAPLDVGRVLDLDVHDGPLPDVWTSQGGALLIRHVPQAVDAHRQAVDTQGTGRRWLRLESATSTRAVVHARVDGRRGGSDPWLVPIEPTSPLAERTRPGRRDHVRRLATEPVAYRANNGPLRFDVWRTQRPRLLPPDATWLRIEADGRVILDGRVPTPVERERLHVTDGCAEVLDLAGRIRVDVPEGTRELRVRGEPGTWLKVLAPLPGTPVEALDVATDAAREHLVAAADEPIERAFDRAARQYPDPLAQAFLARYSYLQSVALRPEGVATLHSRRWRARFIDRDARAAFETQRPVPGETPVAPLAFHWLPAGSRWRIDTAAPGRAGLLRIAVAHPGASSSGTRLRLRQEGRAEVELRLDPAIIHALRSATSDADGLLALDADGVPIVDASQAVLPRMDVATSSVLENTGADGAWVAVDQRVPAPRRLADAVTGGSLLAPGRVQDALLAPAGVVVDQAGTPATTRDFDQARRLIAARAARFAGEPCVQALSGARADPGRALGVLARAADADPVLARCAALQAFAASPDAASVQSAFDGWAARTGQSELHTAARAWALQAPARRHDRGAWAQLALALEAEGEAGAASLAWRAAGKSIPPLEPLTDALPADHAAALVRLRTDRGTEVVYALADSANAAGWVFERSGLHVLELRATASVPQWVRLRSDARTWWTLLPAADADLTALRDVRTSAAPGLAVRVPFAVDVAGQGIEVETVSGEVLGRVEMGADAGEPSGTPPFGDARLQAVALRIADACRVGDLLVQLPIHAPQDPDAAAERTRGARAVSPGADAPIIDEESSPRTATQAALQALRLIDAGRIEPAQAAAAHAYALREADAAAPVPGLFAELDRHIEWRRLRPDAHAGVRKRLVAGGRSTQPLLSRRERWAGLDDDAAFVLRSDQGWVLEGLRPGQSVRLALRAHAALTDQVEVTTTRGGVHRLRDGSAVAVADTADARGELHLRVGQALPGTFVALEVADANGAPLDGRRPVVYHQGPVTVTVAQPTVLRIVEWDGAGANARTQWVGSPGAVRVASRRTGAALRISALQLVPAKGRAPARNAAGEGAVRPAAPAIATASATATQTATATTGQDARVSLAPWPQPWPNSGGEDGTWGLQASWQQRRDPDDGVDRLERFAELRGRWRWQAPEAGLWGRLELIGRRHDAGFGVLGLQHDLQWRQADGPWGATLDAAAWRQNAPAGLHSPAHSASVRAGLDWSRRRDERWRDEWEIGLRWRTLSLQGVDRSLAAWLDNDVYSRYRDTHRRQADIGYRLAWRARYDSEWVFDAQAVTHDLAGIDLDHAGAGLAWRWARHGWTASAGLALRHYLRDDERRVASTRKRVEIAVGRLLLRADDGWRLRLAAGYDANSRQPHAGVTLEWFDHDGRGLDDFAPSELFLRGVTETDLAERLLGPGSLP